ncbi:uncharacterized protein LOC100908452 [Galendromus occidentalis]|uniref:Uncharacterized protein LOC100908452 n=1 Tax=Galendromus occidentalis TaxID=34638 RepID=A0AAJ6QS83_9ACAR|nr:uncharacterized protein LOC100908452 [Galendromus occidentalis]
MIRVLQINLNRCGAAHELALNTATQLESDILLVTEPNVNKLGQNWTIDQKNDAAIKVLGSAGTGEKESNDGFLWRTHANINFYSCYISPNVDITEFGAFLDRLGASLESRPRGQGTVITGDFNSASPLWGSRRANARGRLLEEFIAKHNLTLHNTGNKPTFQRGAQESHLDLTLTNDRIKTRIKGWAVLGELESLSDHNYITFQVTRDPSDSTGNKPRTEKHLDFERCKQELETRLRDKNLTAGVLTKEMKRACAAATADRPPRIKKAYWYNDEIAELRRVCVKSRRKYLRASPENRLRYNLEYTNSRKDLSRSILSSKKETWRKLREEVGRNPWGMAYKIIMNRLNVSITAPPKDMLRATLDVLFPDRALENQAPGSGTGWSRIQEIEEVTDEEIEPPRRQSLELELNGAPHDILASWPRST